MPGRSFNRIARAGGPHLAWLPGLATLGCLCLPPVVARAGCNLETTDLPVTMVGLAPLVKARINGADVTMLVDSGAFFSLLTPATVQQYKLSQRPLPGGIRVRGVGGAANARLTTVVSFALDKFHLSNVEFVVAGNELGNGAAGVVGQNILLSGDVEYDLPNGVIRLVHPSKECKGRDLAYWAGSQAHSSIDIGWTNPAEPHAIGTALINGKKFEVLLDSGASMSLLSLEAAARLGIKPGSPGVQPGGTTYGVGRQAVTTWIAPLASFRIGDEEIRDTRIRIGDLGGQRADMLLGADFLLSHRTYVANSQHKLYFSYSGGPVFSLTTAPQDAARGTPAADDAPAGDDAVEPTTADAFSRRGMAFLARQDLAHAIADLSRACALDPTSGVYFYQRGLARLRDRQGRLAMEDLDEALRLQPGLLDARMLRAEQRQASRDRAGARADLDEAARLVAPEADLHLPLGRAYLQAGAYRQAVTELDLWIGVHGKDVKVADALAERCEAKALGGFGLDQALADCDAALDLRANSGQALSSRGTVRLRRGEYQKAIADFDAALALHASSAWPLLGRGLARLYLGRTNDAQADLSAAEALRPGITAQARALGIAGPDAQASP